jgi:hypothetical protein
MRTMGRKSLLYSSTRFCESTMTLSLITAENALVGEGALGATVTLSSC